MREFLAISKALSDESRVRALLALRDNELCVCQIIELLGLAPSTVSKHMFILKQANLVEGRKDGRWIYYRLASSDASVGVREAISWTLNQLGAVSQIKQDARRLKSILRRNPVEVCKKQREPREPTPSTTSADSVSAR